MQMNITNHTTNYKSQISNCKFQIRYPAAAEAIACLELGK
jgi:hypothetical protein